MKKTVLQVIYIGKWRFANYNLLNSPIKKAALAGGAELLIFYSSTSVY